MIIVDDGSTDESRKILQSYSESCHIIHQKQGGQASAMKAGFEVSNGDYILFLDADDMLYPDTLSLVEQNLCKSSAVKVHFALDVINSIGEVVGRFPRQGVLLSSNDVSQELLDNGTYTYPPCSGNVFCRSFLRQVIPSWDVESYRICADLYLLIKCAFAGEILSIERPLGAYRVHGNNAYGVTRVIELDRTILGRRLKALENKIALLMEACAERQVEVTRDRRWRWVGVFGCKDQILAYKFHRDLLPAGTTSFGRLVRVFLRLAMKSRNANPGDKVKALGFAILAFLPAAILRLLA